MMISKCQSALLTVAALSRQELAYSSHFPLVRRNQSSQGAGRKTDQLILPEQALTLHICLLVRAEVLFRCS